MYDDLERFISYYYQSEFVRKLNPKKILEIGIENKTISNYLKNNGFNVTTCDINKTTKPDYLGDIRKLPFKKNSYDLLMAFQVLEHIPGEDFSIALKELHRVSSKWVILSLPYSALNFSAVVKFPFIKKIIKKEFLNFRISLPYFFMKKPKSKYHFWEIGIKKYSKSHVRSIIKNEGFNILREFRPPINNYHYFLILEKKC